MSSLYGRDIISISDLSPAELRQVVKTALRTKRSGKFPPRALAGKTLALLFEKPSLRTRVSFEMAMYQLGGHCLYLSPQEVGLGKREPVADVARVLARYVDVVAARTFSHKSVEELAKFADISIINALSDAEHPCQAMGDIMTIYERKGNWQGLKLAFIGDGNNVAASLSQAAAMVGMHFIIASPPGYDLPRDVLERARNLARDSGGRIETVREPQHAASKADVLYTDVWTSMGDEDEKEQRQVAFSSYQVNLELVSLASRDVIVMHDLPAHHGEEITHEAFERFHEVIFDQAENRMHAQRSLLFHLLVS